MIIDHIGIAVRSIDRSVEHWQTVFGYQRVTEIVTNEQQKVRVVFLAKPGSLQVKLVEPTDPTSPISALASRGGGLHHLCFRCESVDAEVARLQALGVRLITPPQPGEAFENEKIAFVYVGDGLSIELIDTAKRAGWLEPDAHGTA